MSVQITTQGSLPAALGDNQSLYPCPQWMWLMIILECLWLELKMAILEPMKTKLGITDFK